MERAWHGVVRPSRSVRARVLLWVLVMASLGLALTGTTMLALQARTIDTAADRSLEREYGEFVNLARSGVDPATGQPFDDVARLLRVALQYRFPERNLTYFTMLDGQPYLFSGGARFVRLEDEPAALAAIRAHGEATVLVDDVMTSVGAVRIAVVPVTVAGSPETGTYVMAYAIGLEKEGVAAMARLYLLLAAVALLLIGAAGWFVTGELVRPLALLRAATARTSATDLQARIPVTREDEIGDLARNYNAMLDRLTESFEAQRQLVDDVGHELRTPVTIVRGHLEVLDPRDPDAVAETRALLLDETERMGRLVSDLITLAKTGRPDFLAPGVVEVEELTLEVYEKARALGERRWVLGDVADLRLEADGQRLTEAWLQLAENAVAYSAPGTAVAMGSSLAGAEVRLWVRDEGVGIAPDDQARIFEQFARADTLVDGSGLGLTIARAIMEAHGGRVDVVSTPGVGSTFTLVLPVPAGAGEQARVREGVGAT